MTKTAVSVINVAERRATLCFLMKTKNSRNAGTLTGQSWLELLTMTCMNRERSVNRSIQTLSEHVKGRFAQ